MLDVDLSDFDYRNVGLRLKEFLFATAVSSTLFLVYIDVNGGWTLSAMVENSLLWVGESSGDSYYLEELFSYRFSDAF